VRLRVPSALRASAAGYLKRLDRLSDMALDPRVIAQEMKAAQDDVWQIEPFSRGCLGLIKPWLTKCRT
jgi:hypothetical protein